MARNLLYLSDRLEIIRRIDKLAVENKRLWGKMSVNEMVCHLGDQIQIALGKVELRPMNSLMGRTVIKHLVLLGMPTPKEKISTAPEIDQAKGKGTRPENLVDDCANLKNIIAEFVSTDTHFVWAPHPFFGRLSKKQWGRLAFIHMDHHLKQFSS